ncbi:probable palmitoyltransferase ZDHHC24 [Centruroides vittatus]|uniref:probable palmitoyltransferase ZDHHC24 n=1 Tax=Centruroides vittatus TaxID=120091 RepID=UPI00350EAEE4
MATNIICTLKRYFPRIFSEQLAFVFIIFAIFAIYYFELIIVVPYVHNDTPYLCYIHYVCGTFVMINVFGNFILIVITTSTLSPGYILPSTMRPKWRFCAICEAIFPPRSFHCNICQTCILRRDHHCTFAGCCIGFKNLRYFWLFLFYLSIGTFYATVLNMFYIWDMLGGITLLSVTAHILPFMFWITGYLDTDVVFSTFLSVTSIAGFLFVTSLLVYHTISLLKNQTAYERNNSITCYNLGWKQNIIESLGRRWYLTWIFPLVSSPLPSNGIDFLTKENILLNQEKTK